MQLNEVVVKGGQCQNMWTMPGMLDGLRVLLQYWHIQVAREGVVILGLL